MTPSRMKTFMFVIAALPLLDMALVKLGCRAIMNTDFRIGMGVFFAALAFKHFWIGYKCSACGAWNTIYLAKEENKFHLWKMWREEWKCRKCGDVVVVEDEGGP